MTKLNDPVCTYATIGNNTGLPSCIIVPQNIVGAILIPKATALSAAEVASSAAFITKMQALVLEAPSLRAYPIGPFEEMTDKSEEPSYNTLGYGGKQFSREGKIGWAFNITDGGLMLQKCLRSFNHTKAHAILFFDNNNVVYGVDDGNGGMKGFSLEEFYAHPWKAADGSKPAIFTTEMYFANTTELNEDLVYLKCEVDIASNVKGLIDVELGIISQTSTKVVVSLKTKSAKVNLFAAYHELLADPNAWVVTKAGVAVTPTGVAHIDADEGIEITLTTPSGLHLISLVAPAALEVLNIGGPPDNGYESDVLSVTFS